MTTAKQVTANRQNAVNSTGPKTTNGKARSPANAVRHALRSVSPVIPGESAEEWQSHHDGIIQDLAPVGTLETTLASRVASCLWRLQRVGAFETAVTAGGLEQEDGGNRYGDAAELDRVLENLQRQQQTIAGQEGLGRLLRELSTMPDDEPTDAADVEQLLLTAQSMMPASAQRSLDPDHNPWALQNWAAGSVRKVVEDMARTSGRSATDIIATASAEHGQLVDFITGDVARLESQAEILRQKVQAKQARDNAQRMLPDEETLAKLTRYESHLSRQMLQALHTLERLQAARAGRPAPPPAALDVTVSSDAPLPEVDPTDEAIPGDEGRQGGGRKGQRRGNNRQRGSNDGATTSSDGNWLRSAKTP